MLLKNYSIVCVLKIDKNGTVKRYYHEIGNKHSLSSNSVSSIMQDSKGNIWFSTDRGGVCRFNPQSETFTRFSTEEGLPDNVAYKILEDSIGERIFNLCRISNAYCLLTAGMTLAFQHVHELQHLFKIAGMTREIKL